MPKPAAQPKSKPTIVVTPKPGSNVVEQAPFIGYMLDELIQEQRIALIPLLQVMEQIRKEVTLGGSGGGGTTISVIDKLEQVRQEVAQVKQEIRDRRDAGNYTYQEGTATTTETTIDFIKSLEHPVKAYLVVNDGADTLQIGHTNIYDPVEVQLAPVKFGSVKINESYPVSNNVPSIMRLVIKTATGSANYRLWVYW